MPPKKSFWLRTAFLWSPLLLLALAVGVVNISPKPPVVDSPSCQLLPGSPQKSLLSDSAIHVHLATLLHGECQDSLLRMSQRRTQAFRGLPREMRGLNNLMLGFIQLQQEDYLKAWLYFNRVRDRNLACLQVGLGQAALHMRRYEDAAQAFERAEVSDGDACYELLLSGKAQLYIETQQDPKLWTLWQTPAARPFIPNYQIRQITFSGHSPWTYMRVLADKLRGEFSWIGFLAALAVTLVWLLYLLELHVFAPGSFKYVAFTFGLGMLMCLAAFVLGDLQHIYGGLQADMKGWRSIFYHILAVGAVEELVKILPLALIYRLPGAIKEPYDVILYASTAALGFAFIENGLYYDAEHLHIIHARAMTSVVGHMFTTSLIAYALVWRRIRAKHLSGFVVAVLAWIAASSWHGLTNFLLQHGHGVAYLVQLTVGLYLWTIFINNTLNYSPFFDKRLTLRRYRILVFLTLGLTCVLVVEYVSTHLLLGPWEANAQLQRAALSGSLLIVLLSVILSRFDLQARIWRTL